MANERLGQVAVGTKRSKGVSGQREKDQDQEEEKEEGETLKGIDGFGGKGSGNSARIVIVDVVGAVLVALLESDAELGDDAISVLSVASSADDGGLGVKLIVVVCVVDVKGGKDVLLKVALLVTAADVCRLCPPSNKHQASNIESVIFFFFF